MNKNRRKAIAEIIDQLETVKEQIIGVTEEEQEAYDNMPESLQYSERGDSMSEAITDMENATCTIDDIINDLQNIIDN